MNPHPHFLNPSGAGRGGAARVPEHPRTAQPRAAERPQQRRLDRGLSHSKYLDSRFAKVNSLMNPSTFPL